jgi:membrane-associated phospholipid phosphatase
MSAFFALPTRAHAARCLVVTVLLCALFMAVYSGTNYLTSLRTDRIRIDFAFEHRLPFVPELSIVYSSLYLMFLAVPFVLRTTSELRWFAILMAAITIFAGICFLLLPAEVGFDVPQELGWFPAAFEIADQLNQTYNLCPSLHVAYSAACAEVFRRKNNRYGWPFHLWALAVAVSAWLTYQHHLLDLIAGYALGVSATAVACRRLLAGAGH